MFTGSIGAYIRFFHELIYCVTLRVCLMRGLNSSDNGCIFVIQSSVVWPYMRERDRKHSVNGSLELQHLVTFELVHMSDEACGSCCNQYIYWAVFYQELFDGTAGSQCSD